MRAGTSYPSLSWSCKDDGKEPEPWQRLERVTGLVSITSKSTCKNEDALSSRGQWLGSAVLINAEDGAPQAWGGWASGGGGHHDTGHWMQGLGQEQPTQQTSVPGQKGIFFFFFNFPHPTPKPNSLKKWAVKIAASIMYIPILISCQARLLSHRLQRLPTMQDPASQRQHTAAAHWIAAQAQSVLGTPSAVLWDPWDALMCPRMPKQEIESPRLQCFVKGRTDGDTRFQACHHQNWSQGGSGYKS